MIQCHAHTLAVDDYPNQWEIEVVRDTTSDNIFGKRSVKNKTQRVNNNNMSPFLSLSPLFTLTTHTHTHTKILDNIIHCISTIHSSL